MEKRAEHQKYVITKLAQKLNEPAYFKYNTISQEEDAKLHRLPPEQKKTLGLFTTKDAKGITYHKVDSNQNWIKGAWPAENFGQGRKDIDLSTTAHLSGYDENLAKQFPDYTRALINWNISHGQAAAEKKAIKGNLNNPFSKIKIGENNDTTKRFYGPITKENSNKQFFSKPN